MPSTRFKFGNPDLQCTIHRNRLQDINQQFLKFRFSKGTNVELKEAVKHFTTEYRSGGVLKVDKLRLGKKIELTRVMLRNWRLRHCRILMGEDAM